MSTFLFKTEQSLSLGIFPELWDLLEKELIYPNWVKIFMCTFPQTDFTSFSFYAVSVSSKKRKKLMKGRSQHFRSDCKRIATWSIGEMKVLLLLSLPSPVLIWMMWKHQYEGREVSYDARVGIWKFRLILKARLIWEWDLIFGLSLWKLFLFNLRNVLSCSSRSAISVGFILALAKMPKKLPAP